MRANIFDISKASYVDGPGIRTTVFFKGESLQWNHFVAFGCLIAAVFFVFLK